MLMVPLRGGPGFDAALHVTVFEPGPFPPEVTTSQETLLAAVQLVVDGVTVTAKLPVPPEALIVPVVGVTVYSGALVVAPAWVMLKTMPPAVIEPLREAVAVLVATV